MWGLYNLQNIASFKNNMIYDILVLYGLFDFFFNQPVCIGYLLVHAHIAIFNIYYLCNHLMLTVS